MEAKSENTGEGEGYSGVYKKIAHIIKSLHELETLTSQTALAEHNNAKIRIYRGMKDCLQRQRNKNVELTPKVAMEAMKCLNDVQITAGDKCQEDSVVILKDFLSLFCKKRYDQTDESEFQRISRKPRGIL